jgi:hypothetical protein
VTPSIEYIFREKVTGFPQAQREKIIQRADGLYNQDLLCQQGDLKVVKIQREYPYGQSQRPPVGDVS